MYIWKVLLSHDIIRMKIPQNVIGYGNLDAHIEVSVT